MSNVFLKASQQWSTRPSDERFTSLYDMQDHFTKIRNESRQVVVPSRRIHALPDPDNKGLQIVGPNGHAYAPTHWSFGQLAQLAEAPAGYMRTLPSPIAADCINYGLQYKRKISDVGVLLQKNGEHVMRAVTGPNYGRIWNADIVHGLTDRFGDGVSGQWKVPGEFGRDVIVTKENTTLYASDQDMFIFLCDEKNRIEIPNRRNGQPGQMARGFFVWNSEVGAATLGIATFLFDYVCSNRIVWGGTQYSEIKIRHTASAPDKWIDEVTPALNAYSESSAKSITDGIAKAQAARLDNVDDFLAKRFGKRMAPALQEIHAREEGRPVETIWDATTAATAYARGIENQDARVTMERTAGALLDLAA